MLRQQRLYTPAMLRAPGGHRWRRGTRSAETRMRGTKIIHRADQIHPVLQGYRAACQRPASTCQRGQAFAERRVQSLDIGGIDHPRALRAPAHGVHLLAASTRADIALPVAAAAVLVTLAAAIAPRGPGEASTALAAGRKVTFDDVHRIIESRCVACHSATPTHPTAPVAAAGVKLDSPREIGVWAPRIFERVVVTRTMPLANLTEMTDKERAVLERWYADGAHTD